MRNKIKTILEQNYTSKGFDLQQATDQLLILYGVVSCVCKIPEPRMKNSENGISAYCNKCAKSYSQK